MQNQAPPQATTPPPAPTPVVTIPALPGSQPISIAIPRNGRDLAALKARREELSYQLNSVDNRRKKLMDQLRRTDDATATKGLQDRLSLLDARQLQLENDLSQTGQMLSSAAAGAIASASAPPFVGGLSSGQVMGLSVLSIIFVLFPLAAGVGRAIFKRASKSGMTPPQAFVETAQRLERLESSVDAIAIEIERISEGQRFVTKLLAEGQPAPMIGSAAPATVRASK